MLALTQEVRDLGRWEVYDLVIANTCWQRAWWRNDAQTVFVILGASNHRGA